MEPGTQQINRIVKSQTVIDAAKARKIWIHCNSCLEHYVDQKSVILLLACQHVVCDKCVKSNLGRIPGDAPTYICPVCRKNVRGRQVNNALPTNLKDMFHPEPWHDGLPHDLIDKFQRANKKNIKNHMSKRGKDLCKVQKDTELAYRISQKQLLEIRRERVRLRQTKLRVRKIKQQALIRREEAKKRVNRHEKQEFSNTSHPSQSKHQARAQSETVSPFRSATPNIKGPENGSGSSHSAITSFIHNNNHSFIL